MYTLGGGGGGDPPPRFTPYHFYFLTREAYNSYSHSPPPSHSPVAFDHVIVVYTPVDNMCFLPASTPPPEITFQLYFSAFIFLFLVPLSQPQTLPNYCHAPSNSTAMALSAQPPCSIYSRQLFSVSPPPPPPPPNLTITHPHAVTLAVCG